MADYARLLDLIERYDRTIAQLEASVITKIERNLDAAFRTLEREFRRTYGQYLEGGSLTASIQTAALMQELGSLLEIVRPEMASEYRQLFQDAMSLASGLGESLAQATTELINPGYNLGQFQGVPIEFIANQARDAVDRLYRYNDDMRTSISAIVQIGFGSNWGTNRVAQELRRSLGLTKTKAETLARTEMMASVNAAAEARYNAAGLFVQVLNSPSEGLCGLCAARNGNVYRVGQVRVPFHPRCLVTGTLVSADGVKAGASRKYRGKVVSIQTASGKKLTATPNHPVLTQRGWIGLGLLKIGDYVFSGCNREGVSTSVAPNDHKRPAPIEKIVASLSKSTGMSTVSMKVSPVDFHGDGKGSDVCVISSDGLLRDNVQAFLSQPINHEPFAWRLVNTGSLLPSGLSAFNIPRDRPASRCSMCRSDLALPLFRGHTLPLQDLGFGGGSNSYAGFFKNPSNGRSANTKMACNGLFRSSRIHSQNILPYARVSFSEPGIDLGVLDGSNFFKGSLDSSFFQDLAQDGDINSGHLRSVLNGISFEIEQDAIVDISTSDYLGHVYNLETERGWYLANSILTHNCRCALVPWSEAWLKDGLVDTEWLKEYHSKGLEQAQANGFRPDYQASYWERKAGAETAPEPIWKPTG